MVAWGQEEARNYRQEARALALGAAIPSLVTTPVGPQSGGAELWFPPVPWESSSHWGALSKG